MGQSIKDVMTSNPCSIDADKSVAYAAKMMRDEDVGLAPIVEGDKLIGMLTDRDIAIRVVAEGRDPGQVKVRDVASKQVVTIDPQQDLDEALRIMAKQEVPVQSEEEGITRVRAASSRGRKRSTTSRARKTGTRKASTTRKRKTTSRSRSTGGTRRRSTTAKSRSTGARKKSTTTRRKTTGTRA